MVLLAGKPIEVKISHTADRFIDQAGFVRMEGDRKMLRNSAWRRMLAGFLVIAAICVGGAFRADHRAGWITLAGMTAVCGSFCLYTLQRYREIRRLLDYLAAVRGGERSLDIRDNREGEFSILKNDIYKLTVTLQEQSELLEKERNRLADALADVSHQLKTPLTSMRVMADLLGTGTLDAERHQEFSARLSGQLDRIEWLVGSLLKLSRIDAGAIHFRQEVFSLEDTVRKALAPLLIPAELREQMLWIQGDGGTTVLGDAAWTGEALVNILKNCLEHTPRGGSILLAWHDTPIHTELRILDSGCGIDPEDLPHIFERFYRGKNASPDSAGIGLAMARAILRGQNADLQVKSVPGEGACFILRFYKAIV